jgi:hypothetical protein
LLVDKNSREERKERRQRTSKSIIKGQTNKKDKITFYFIAHLQETSIQTLAISLPVLQV